MEKFMKRWLLIIFTAIMSISLASCGGNDKDNDSDVPLKDDLSEKIIGKWIVDQSFAEDIDKGESFYFLSSGIVTWNGDNYCGKYTLDKENLTITFIDEDGDIERMSGTVTIDGNIMSYSFTWYWSYGDEYCYDNTMILRKVS